MQLSRYWTEGKNINYLLIYKHPDMHFALCNNGLTCFSENNILQFNLTEKWHVCFWPPNRLGGKANSESSESNLNTAWVVKPRLFVTLQLSSKQIVCYIIVNIFFKSEFKIWLENEKKLISMWNANGLQYVAALVLKMQSIVYQS